MEPESMPPAAYPETSLAPEAALMPEAHAPDAEEYRGLRWAFIGSQGLRAGWSVTLFLFLTVFFMAVLQTAAMTWVRHIPVGDMNNLLPQSALLSELTQFPALLAAMAILALIEGRSIFDYNLAGPRRIQHFVGGLAAGFVALSALVAAMAWGGWLHFGPVALSGTRIFSYAAVWGAVFLLTGLFEEGGFRCYLQFTLTRGVNFWWALALVAATCLVSSLAVAGQGVRGVYCVALLGLLPCLLLHIKKTPRTAFWQAAWVTSTFFGAIHLSNGGENWIGIFCAGAIGFVFCVSVRLTGSAWWAIGCHSAWDWAETYFYGTANSGLVAQGHYLSASPSGNALWSGGADGPEGSLLVFGVLLLLLAALVVLYGRRKPATAS